MRRHILAFFVGAFYFGVGASCGSTEPIHAQTPGPQGPQGPAGPQGPIGPQGPAGPAGSNGVSGYEVVTRATDIAGGPGMNLDAVVGCPTGKKPIGGGVQQIDSPSAVVTGSYPGPAAEGAYWHIQLRNDTYFAHPLTLYAVCAIAN